MLVGVLLGGVKVVFYDYNRIYEIIFEFSDGIQEVGLILINYLYDMFIDWV